MDYQHNNLYFSPTTAKVAYPKSIGRIPFIAITIGIVIIITWRSTRPKLFIVGFVLIVLGIAWIIFRVISNRIDAQEAVIFNNNRIIVTGAELDRICTDYLKKNLKSMAKMKLDIDEDQVREVGPIQIDGYDYKELNTIEPEIKKGDDGKFRSSHYSGTMFLFSADQVFYYQLRFSLISDAKQEITREFHYDDIVDTSTESSTRRFGDGLDKYVNYEEFLLVTTGGTKMGASLSGSDKENTDRSIRGMRSLLRSKKQSGKEHRI